jgi:hypothetical protein
MPAVSNAGEARVASVEGSKLNTGLLEIDSAPTRLLSRSLCKRDQKQYNPEYCTRYLILSECLL